MNTLELTNPLIQFRQQVYASFPHHPDSLMDLVDALCANQGVQSVVELSLNPLFRRGYSALYTAIGALGDLSGGLVSLTSGAQARFPSAWIEAISGVVPPPERRKYWLFGLDVTPVVRPHAATLKDREFVYQPTVITSNKPITLGHNYSLLAVLPERETDAHGGARWIVPVSVERVSSFESKSGVGQSQVNRLLNDPSLAWHQQLCVLVADSDYGHREFLYGSDQDPNHVIITRLRSNRVFYRQPEAADNPGRGHPRWYGERFDLKDESTWGAPDRQEHFSSTTATGKIRNVTVRVWDDLLMRGSKDKPMHRHPFALVQVESTDTDGNRLFKPQWLIVFGQARQQLSGRDACEAYAERFNLEHGIRFCKQHLLMSQLQTPEVTQEESWVQLCWLAYAQLWVARSLANVLPQPWQKYLPTYKQGHITPSAVQRDFYRIIRQIGTPAADAKPRGKSSGRPLGTTLDPRPRRPIVKRGPVRRKKAKKAA